MAAYGFLYYDTKTFYGYSNALKWFAAESVEVDWKFSY
jgi:hypothetical protein